MARQSRLPGTGDASIPEIESAAEEYVKLRDKRMKILTQEVESKTTLMTVMKSNKKNYYSYDGLEVRIVRGDEKVKVSKADAEDDEESVEVSDT